MNFRYKQSQILKILNLYKQENNIYTKKTTKLKLLVTSRTMGSDNMIGKGIFFFLFEKLMKSFTRKSYITLHSYQRALKNKQSAAAYSYIFCIIVFTVFLQ